MKKQRCRDFDEKGICTMAEYCPYDHGEVVIAPAMQTEPEPVENQVIPTTNPINQNFPQPMPNNQIYNQNSNMNFQPQQQQQQKHHNRQPNLKPRRNLNKQPLLPMPPGMNQSTPPQQQQQQQQQQQRFNNKGQNFNQRPPNLPQTQAQQVNQTNEMFNQQRQMNANRPRNLVSIVTSIHEEDQGDNQTQGFTQQRGMKRTCEKILCFFYFF